MKNVTPKYNTLDDDLYMQLQTSLYTSTHAERVRKKSASRTFGATLIKPRNDVVKNSYYHFIRLALEK